MWYYNQNVLLLIKCRLFKIQLTIFVIHTLAFIHIWSANVHIHTYIPHTHTNYSLLEGGKHDLGVAKTDPCFDLSSITIDLKSWYKGKILG